MKQYLNILLAAMFMFTSVSFAQTKVDGSQLKGDVLGGTAANNRRLVLPKDTKTNLDAKTRIEGNLLFDTVSKKPYFDDGTSLKLVGSGSGGGVRNLITNGSAADATASILIPYADAAGVRPVDGTGGSPASATGITKTGGGPYPPLFGTQSYHIGKGVANRQGEGYAIPFTVTLGDFSKMMSISFDYASIVAAPIIPGDTTTDGDYYITVYDVTNAKFIEPSNTKLFSSSGAVPGKYQGSFQTSATGTSYRLIIHTTTTRTPSFGIILDNITVTPNNYVYATSMTDALPFTPTGSWTTNATYNGLQKRVADTLFMQVRVLTSGAPTGNLTINLPPGLTIDASKLTSSLSNNTGLKAKGYALDNGAAVYDLFAVYKTSTSFDVYTSSAASTYTSLGTQVSPTIPFTFGASDWVEVNVEVPILGWSSNTQISDGYDGRLIAANYTTLSSTSYTFPNALRYTTKVYDYTNSYNTTTGEYTCPSSGLYKITVASSYGTILIALNWQIYKNAVLALPIGIQSDQNRRVNGSVTIECNGGEKLTIVPANNETFGATDGQLYIEKLQSPAIISSQPLYLMSRNIPNAATIQVLGSGPINFSTAVEDTHGQYVSTSGGTGFKAAIAGWYVLSVGIRPTSTTTIYIYKNGSQFFEWFAVGSGLSNSGVKLIKLNVDDVVDIRSGQATTTQAEGYFDVSLKK